MTPAHREPHARRGDIAPAGTSRPPAPGPRPTQRRALKWPVFVLPILLIVGGAVARLIDDARHEVTGTVLNPQGQPLAGVLVAVPQLNLATHTEADGRFTLYIPGPPQEVSLRVRGADLAPMQEQVRSGTHGLSLRLQPP